MSDDASLAEKGKDALEEVKSRKERFDATHPGRTLKRVSDGNGNLLAGGITYLSLTSIAAALVIAITVSTFLVKFNAGWNEAFYGFIDDAIPGVIGADGAGLVDPTQIEPQTLTGVVGVIGFLILLNTTARYISALRLATLEMLGKNTLSPMKGKLRDFGVLLALLIVVLLGVVLQVVASQFAEVIANWLSIELLSQWIIRVPAFAVGVLVDMTFVALAVVILGRYRGPRAPLLWTLLIAAVAMGVLRQAVTLVVGGVADNPVLASATAVITIMIFVNFISRIILYAAAWLGTLPKAVEAEIRVTEMEPHARRERGTVTTARATKRNH